MKYFHTSFHERFVLYALALALALVGSLFAVNQPQSVKLEVRNVTSGALYTPSPTFYGLRNVYTIVYSSYYNEASLIGWHQPVGDLDNMIPCSSYSYGTCVNAPHDQVYIPGDRRQIYGYFGSAYIPGSGIVEEWGTPNGGRFAFLHIWQSTASAMNQDLPKLLHMKKPKPCRSVQPCNNDRGDENTVLAFNYIVSHSARTSLASEYRGGRYVGLTGWPTDPYYGNGASGPGNDHLCVVLDWLADQYFSQVAQQSVFHLKVWNRYLARHRKRLISPYSGQEYTPSALAWMNYQTALQGVVSRGIWHPKGGFMQQRFQGGELTFWPRHPGWIPKIQKMRFLS